MEKLSIICLALFVGLCSADTLYFKSKKKPVWSDSYIASGTLNIPYAEIVEPFKAYYDFKANNSRIDYYGGIVSTIQNASKTSQGNAYKITPVTNYKFSNKKMCFLTKGTKSAPISIQSVLPNITQFTFEKTETKMNVSCDKWIYSNTVGTKVNTYSLWVNTANEHPVFYEMMGYDSLFSSHYDKYYMIYDSYVPIKGSVGAGNFTSPRKGLKCGDYPGPGITMNPMREFIENDDSHVNTQFTDFKSKHNKVYPSSESHNKRLHTFRQNLRFINSKNRQGLSYTLSINHMADHSNEELKSIRGRLKSPGYNGGLPYKPSTRSSANLPQTLDWRLYGAVTPVKDQAVCGSCWSFGTTGTLEGSYFLKTGKLVRFSQQELMDCSWGEGNNACDGGEEFRAYQWIMKTGGLATEDSYGMYSGQNGYCHANSANRVLKIQSYMNITSGDLSSLKVSLAERGPISVGIDASHRSLSFYSNGVYYEPKCGNTPDDLDHAVLAVGYGVMNGQPYWLIKNSWSTHWGNDGYVLMSMKNNNCGVATDATFAQLA